MLAIQPAKQAAGKCTPNVLPCRINRDGPVDASERYWAPETGEDGKRTSHFRGRRLQGRTVKVPAGYRGVVVNTTDKVLPQPEPTMQPTPSNDVDDDMEDEAEEPQPVGVMEESAQFDEVVVWAHDVLPDEASDAYVKGVEEWIGFAEQMNSYSVPSTQNSESNKS
ncbi:MAG: hypothetical protein M1817_005308 [Caeruleum heppii]|nr:MAG: hypothetical protein M1817_005308 [Caeruleum heppii]